MSNYYETIAGFLIWSNSAPSKIAIYKGYAICLHPDGPSRCHFEKTDRTNPSLFWQIQSSIYYESVAEALEEIDNATERS